MKFITAVLLLISLNAFAQVSESEAGKAGLFEVYVTSSAAISSFRVEASGVMVSNESSAKMCLMIGEAAANFQTLATLRKVQNITGLEISQELNEVRLARVAFRVEAAAKHCRYEKSTTKSVKKELQDILDAFQTH